MQTDLGIDSIFDDESVFLPGRGGSGKHLPQREMYALLYNRQGRQSTSECVDSHLPSAQDNSHALLKYFVI